MPSSALYHPVFLEDNFLIHFADFPVCTSAQNPQQILIEIFNQIFIGLVRLCRSPKIVTFQTKLSNRIVRITNKGAF